MFITKNRILFFRCEEEKHFDAIKYIAFISIDSKTKDIKVVAITIFSGSNKSSPLHILEEVGHELSRHGPVNTTA